MDAQGPANLETRLIAFIGAQKPEARRIVVKDITPVSGGNARRAYAFDAGWDGRGKRHEMACILLAKAEPGQLETDLETEFHVLRALAGTGVPAPAALWIDPTGHALGYPSLIMERVAGTSNIKSLLAAEPAATNRAIAETLAEVAARLHAVDWRGHALGALTAPSPETAAIQQVLFWESLYLKNRMEPLPALASAFRWLMAHAPAAERIVLLHGDFRLGNFLYEGREITAMLDWEMTHLGDPVEDIAWAYRPLWSPQRHVTLEAFCAMYTARSGIPVPAPTLQFYRLFSEIKHAVISLNAARAFADGRGRTLRMADRMTMVPGLLKQFQDWVQAA